MIVSDFKNYGNLFSKYVKKDIFNLLALGCGVIRGEEKLNAKHIFGVEWCDERLDISKEKAIVIKYDIKEVPKIIPDKSFDAVTMFDVIEHITKEEGLKLLKELEKKIKYQILLFVPIQKKIPDINYLIDLQEKRKEENLSLGHHLSIWTPEEFEALGFTVEYSPEYHKDKNMGAVFCVKNLIN